MSWDAYITSNLMAPLDEKGTTLESAAIVGQDGGVWAQSEGFPAVTLEEVASLLSAMTDMSVPSVHVAGEKYLKLMADDKMVRCRKDKLGFEARKTVTAIVVGFYREPLVTAQTCSKVVQALGDYLEESGY